MSLSTEEVKKIAALARLRLEPEEIDLFAQQLTQILHYIDQLSEFEPLGPDDEREGVREGEDRPAPGLSQEALLRNAPESLDTFFLVPQVKPAQDE